MIFLIGFNNGDGGLPRPHLAPGQTEAVHHDRTIPGDGVRPHFGARRRQEADAGNAGKIYVKCELFVLLSVVQKV